jgi:hypothetical protein
MATRLLAVAGLLAVLAASCGGRASAPTSETTTKNKTMVVTLEPTTLPKELPPEACFVGVHSYDVMLLGTRLPDTYSCARVADVVLPGAEQLPWSRAEYHDEHQVEECELERGGGRLQVLRGDPDQEGARFEAAYDVTERACARLEREGWTAIFQEK